MTWSIINKKADKFKTFEIIATISIIIVTYFGHISINISRY